jgi:hypothetical protein
MAWLMFLYNLSLLISVGVDAIVLCHIFPAFRRTRNKAFLFIAIACVLGIVDTVWDHTGRLQATTDHSYIVLRTIRRFTYFANCIVWCIGVLLLTRSYLAGQFIAPPNSGPTEEPPLAN